MLSITSSFLYLFTTNETKLKAYSLSKSAEQQNKKYCWSNGADAAVQEWGESRLSYERLL